MIKRHIIFAASFVTTIIIGYSDYLSGVHVSMMLLYAVPVLLSAWYCGKVEGIFVAVGATVSWFLVNANNNPSGESEAVMSWNAFTRFGIFVLIAYTVSLQAQLRRALERERLRSETDRLTGLLNKGAFRDRVEEEMDRARRYKHSLSLAFIDLDNFKRVNDTQGHARGDRLLQQVSETILHAIRRTDIAGRIGGDEFAVCFAETGEEEARKAINHLLKTLQIMTSQSGWQVTASIGVVTCRELCDTYDALLGKADKQMYLAKEKGKNTAEFVAI
ncbi:diguanylate cyclase [Pelotalea chapellei]|uniref:diguanylate cyclase n=1 Tax=Pelotalea chapellei TaxID=44671 RepID=A0ABS5U3V4_9BACT|nr:diguanylate cyclase [Pelotalea chapellei]MBT1070354.1 GGDEF domain-containing protein [Pelotalea chapellei]